MPKRRKPGKPQKPRTIKLDIEKAMRQKQFQKRLEETERELAREARNLPRLKFEHTALAQQILEKDKALRKMPRKSRKYGEMERQLDLDVEKLLTIEIIIMELEGLKYSEKWSRTITRLRDLYSNE